MAQDKDREIAFLQQASRVAAENEAVQQAFSEQQDAVKQATKNLTNAQKEMQSEIDNAIKREKNKISDAYNARIDERSNQIKKVKGQRDKMRAQGVKERIGMETASLIEANKAVKESTLALYKENKVPRFANSAWFYTLFVTSGVKEYLLLILTVAVLLIGLPILIYLILGRPGALWMVLIYLLDVLFFGGIYLLIMNNVKVKHAPVIHQGRQRWNMILDNRRKIKSITKNIARDRDDSLYGLQEFDAQLMQLEQDKRTISEERHQALTQFDNEGRARITAEVQEANRSRIEQLQAEVDSATKRFDDLMDQSRSIQATIASDYEPRVGKEFMTSDKIEKLLVPLRSGDADTLADAQEFVRRGKTPTRGGAAVETDDAEEFIPSPSEIGGAAVTGKKEEVNAAATATPAVMANPAETADPAETANLAESAKSAETAKPSESASLVASAVPTESTAMAQSANPTETAKPQEAFGESVSETIEAE